MKYPNLGSRLDELVVGVEAGAVAPDKAAAEFPIHREASVAVSIYLSGKVEVVARFLKENAGDPRNVGEGYIEAYVPVTVLGPISELPGVLRVRAIIPPKPARGG